MSITAIVQPAIGTTKSNAANPTVQPRLAPKSSGNPSNRWGVVLAGGDGVRLRELTQMVSGDDRPKQFCPLLGNRTLLEETRRRAERTIRPKRILFAVAREHEHYYLRYLAAQASQRIVQPCNKGTAPAILYTLLRIARMDPEAIVAIFPCDHYYAPESAFTTALESAFTVAEQQADSVVLLGAQPKGPEVEYGWIEVGEAIRGRAGLFRVKRFQEKPALAVAEDLFRSGSLWNTFVMIGHARTILEMARDTVPALLEVLESGRVMQNPGGEIRIPDSVYDRITPTDFSRQVLSAATDRLLTLRLTGIEWNDLGDPSRVLATLADQKHDLPGWAKQWPRVSMAAA
jgi:mannose-1-phosphate guanylyltransferase